MYIMGWNCKNLELFDSLKFSFSWILSAYFLRLEVFDSFIIYSLSLEM